MKALEICLLKTIFQHFTVTDEFVKQASVDSQIKAYKLDRDSIIREVNHAIK